VNDPVRIHFNRKIAFAAALGFGMVLATGMPREFASHSYLSIALTVLVLGGPFLVCAARAVRRHVVITIDSDGVDVSTRGGGRFRWDEISAARVSCHQSMFGMEHKLILTTNGERSTEATARLDMLSLKWDVIVRLAEERLGRAIPRSRSGPFQA